MVTRVASPPKALMFSCIHDKADQVTQRIVRGSCVFLTEKGFVIQETEDAEAVPDRDADNIFASEFRAVKQRLEGIAVGEASTVDPNKDGERSATFGRRDVQVEAVFAVRYFRQSRLHGRCRELRRLTFALPCGHFFCREKP
jgi:hypothetical protein